MEFNAGTPPPPSPYGQPIIPFSSPLSSIPSSPIALPPSSGYYPSSSLPPSSPPTSSTPSTPSSSFSASYPGLGKRAARYEQLPTISGKKRVRVKHEPASDSEKREVIDVDAFEGDNADRSQEL
ncbi:hypothetical protein BC629DRAFT_1444016 [Irpex lacteus]|nr:hypothetical protein BC629DRAFT_1444016 [Irpex lacteus]